MLLTKEQVQALMIPIHKSIKTKLKIRSSQQKTKLKTVQKLRKCPKYFSKIIL